MLKLSLLPECYSRAIDAYDSDSSDLCCDLEEGTTVKAHEYWRKAGNVRNFRFQKKTKTGSQFRSSGIDEEYNSGHCHSNGCSRDFGPPCMHRALNVANHCSNKDSETTISSRSSELTDEDCNCHYCFHKQSNFYRRNRYKQLEKCDSHFSNARCMKVHDTSGDKNYKRLFNHEDGSHCFKCGKKIDCHYGEAVHDVYYGENTHAVYKLPIDLDTNSIVLELPWLSQDQKNDKNVSSDDTHIKRAIRTSHKSSVNEPKYANKNLMCSIGDDLSKYQTVSTQTSKRTLEGTDTSKEKIRKLKEHDLPRQKKEDKNRCRLPYQQHNYRNTDENIKETSYIDLSKQNQINNAFGHSDYQQSRYNLNRNYSTRESNCTLTLYPNPISDINSFIKVRRLMSKTKPLSYAFFEPISFDKPVSLSEEEAAPQNVKNLTKKPVYTLPSSCKSENYGIKAKQLRTEQSSPNDQNHSKEDDDAIPVFIAISGSSFALHHAHRLKRHKRNRKCPRRRSKQMLAENRASLPTIYESFPSSEDECSSSLITLQGVKIRYPFPASEVGQSLRAQDRKPQKRSGSQKKCKRFERGSASTPTTMLTSNTFPTEEDKVCDYYLQPADVSWGNWEKLRKKLKSCAKLNNTDVQSLLYVRS